MPKKLSLEVAQASIENQNISDIKVVLEYADSNCNKWVTGNQVIITVSAYVKTMSPFLSGERSIVHMVTIEDSDELVGNGNAEKNNGTIFCHMELHPQEQPVYLEIWRMNPVQT